MSYHSHSSTPAVIAAQPATSPKYSMSGLANEINQMKVQNGLLSTFFGRRKYGTADSTSSKYRAMSNVKPTYSGVFGRETTSETTTESRTSAGTSGLPGISRYMKR